VRKPKEIERLRASYPPACAAFRRIPSELQDPRLFLVQLQAELGHPGAQVFEKRQHILPLLEAHDTVIGIPNDDHIAFRLVPPPSMSPQVEHVVQVDVGKQR
jgi:hypothetical protein